jgi:hypothetical protein
MLGFEILTLPSADFEAYGENSEASNCPKDDFAAGGAA